MLLGSRIQEKWGQDGMEIGADGGVDRGHTIAGVPCASAVPPGWDMVVPPAPHRVLAQSGQVLDVSPRLGQVMAVSLLQLLPGALHLLPATGDHWHHSTSTHTPHLPDGPKRTKPDFKARPLFGWGRPFPGSKPMFFPCTVLHQAGNPQESLTCRAKELLPYTSIPRRVGGTESDTQGCQAVTPTPSPGPPALTWHCPAPPAARCPFQ